MPAVGRFMGTPASIRASDEPQTVAIDDEPFELGDLGHDPDRIGKFRRRGQHRTDGAPGKLAMPDFAASGRAHAAALANRIGGEIVMQKEALLVGALQTIDVLLVLPGAKRRDDQRLRLAAGEKRRAMGPRQDAYFRDNRTDRLFVAPVDSDAGVENVPADNLGLQVVKDLGDLLLGKLLLSSVRQKCRENFCLHRIDRVVAVLLRGDLVGLAQFGLGDLAHRGLDFAPVGDGEFARLLGGLFGEFDDRVDHRLKSGMAGHDGLEHGRLGEFLGFGFDHQHGVACSGDHEVERGVLQLLQRRIDFQRAIDEAEPRRSDRPHERDARQGQRRRTRDHSHNIGIVLEVVRKHRRDDLRLVAITLGKQWADRAVDQAGDEGLLFRRAALALEITARNAARRERLLLIIDRQGEEIAPGLGYLGRDDSGKDRGFAIGRDDGAIGLAGDLAGFEDELAPGPIEFFTMDFKHSFVFLGKGEAQGQSKTARSCATAPGDPAMSIGLHHGLARRPHAAALPDI